MNGQGSRPNMSQVTWMTLPLFHSFHHLRPCWRLTVEESLGKVLARDPGDAFVLQGRGIRSQVPIHDFTVQ